MSSANATAAPTEKIVVDATYGALYICTTVAVTLWGILCVQYYTYARDYPNDRRFIKYTVSSLFLMNTANQMFWCQTIYTYMVKGFDNPTSRNWDPWGITASSFISAFMILMVQGFYVWRLWLMSHGNVALCAAIGISSLAAFIFNIMLFVTVLPIKNYDIFSLHPHLRQEIATLDYGVLVCGAASDVLIAGSFVFLLLKLKPDTKRSNSLINRLVLFSIRTGLFTSTFAFGSLILRTVKSKVDAKIFFPIATGIYANSMLALLNERKALRRNAHQVSSMSAIYDGWEHSGTGLDNHTSSRSALDTHVTTHCNERSEHISIVVSGDGESGDYNSSAMEEGEISKAKS